MVQEKLFAIKISTCWLTWAMITLIKPLQRTIEALLCKSLNIKFKKSYREINFKDSHKTIIINHNISYDNLLISYFCTKCNYMLLQRLHEIELYEYVLLVQKYNSAHNIYCHPTLKTSSPWKSPVASKLCLTTIVLVCTRESAWDIDLELCKILRTGSWLSEVI